MNTRIVKCLVRTEERVSSDALKQEPVHLNKFNSVEYIIYQEQAIYTHVRVFLAFKLKL